MKMVRPFASLVLLITHVHGAELPPPTHSLDAFARNVFEAYRQADFDTFYQSTIFALPSERFKLFMLQVKNDDIRNSLTKGKWSKWKKELDPAKAEAEWERACIKEWRKPYGRLQQIGLSSIRHEAFENIQAGAEKEGIRSLSPPHKWETSRLTAVEVLHKISTDKQRFKIDGIVSPAPNWEAGLTYRLQFDLTTHGYPFRFSPTSNGPIVFERGVTREAHGNKDLIIRLDELPRALHYFCPTKKDMGNQIDFSIGKKHIKQDVLLTFTHGTPLREYRILLRDCLPIPPAWALDKSWRLRNNGEYYVHARQEGALPRSFYAVASKDSWALDKSWRQHNKGGYYIHARQEGAFPRSFNAVEDKGGWILTEEKDGERFYVLGNEKGAPFRTLQEAYAHLKVMLEQWILTEEKGGNRFYVLRNKKIDSFNTLEEAYAHLKVMLEQWLLFDRPIWLGSVLKEPSIE